MAAPYKLRCNVVGHSKDVRSLASSLIPEGGIISGSRDCTTRIWSPNEHDVGFTEGQVLQGHSNFVAAVCVLPPDDQHQNGLVVTGSNDSTILMFEPGKLEATHKLTGHTNTVCALAAGKFGFLLSGSWDKTAKVWLNQKCVMTLEGHESAVWAVAVMSQKGMMLTGSADKTIKMWKAGKCERTFTGHEDCVRGLAVVEDGVFLSCSNDATIRRWLTSGDCVNVYYGHANYVYSIALLPNGTDFVSGGEDRTVRVWRNGECAQTIPHPTQSVWCVCALPNGDIVTGASDGMMRVFTTVSERMASAEDQKAFEDVVASSAIPTQLGDINKEDLPGPEALLNPGRKEGQTKMVRQGDHVELYSWDTSESRWTKIGDVVGSSGGTQATSGKTLFEGKEYDYVFDVDIEEGKPPLKLPYNITEDPWFAAQAFLHRNNLSQLFLDQVANFITQNAKGVTLGTQSTGYSDPFTGGNRYVPAVSGAAGDNGNSAADPFTGGNSYRPSGGPQNTVGADPFTGAGSYRPGESKPGPAAAGNSYFPVTAFLTMDNINPKQIIGKLDEFNKSFPANQQISGTALSGLEQILSGQASDVHIATLQQLLEWPSDKLFPALDILRIGVKYSLVCNHFCQQQGFLQFLCKFLSPGNLAPNQMLTLRTIANLFVQPEGLKLLSANQSQVLQSVLLCEGVTNKNAQIALATVILNFSIAATMAKNFDLKSECAAAVSQLLKKEFDSEAVYRLLVAMGTLVHSDEGCQAVVQSLEVMPVLQNIREKSDLNKVIECADMLLKL